MDISIEAVSIGHEADDELSGNDSTQLLSPSVQLLLAARMGNLVIAKRILEFYDGAKRENSAKQTPTQTEEMLTEDRETDNREEDGTDGNNTNEMEDVVKDVKMTQKAMNLEKVLDEEGKNVLILAVDNDQWEVLKYLLKRGGCINSWHEALLHVQSVKSAKILIKHIKKTTGVQSLEEGEGKGQENGDGQGKGEGKEEGEQKDAAAKIAKRYIEGLEEKEDTGTQERREGKGESGLGESNGVQEDRRSAAKGEVDEKRQEDAGSGGKHSQSGDKRKSLTSKQWQVKKMIADIVNIRDTQGETPLHKVPNIVSSSPYSSFPLHSSPTPRVFLGIVLVYCHFIWSLSYPFF